MNLNQITVPALDIEASVAFYRQLGLRQIVDSPHYARFESANGPATFSVHACEAPIHTAGVVIYFECEDLDKTVSDLLEKGIVFTQQPTDQRWLWREARLLDPGGNTLCLYHAGSNRTHPPWRINNTKRNL